MLLLSEIQGRYAVGAITFTTPARPGGPVGTVKLRNSTSSPPEPALFLQEVAFTAYYPTESGRASDKGLHWLIRFVELLIFLPSS
jgi:platelet-activating factor acetylhydrolase